MDPVILGDILEIADRALATSQRDPAERTRDYMRRLRAGEITGIACHDKK